jgi:hypothetical protein
MCQFYEVFVPGGSNMFSAHVFGCSGVQVLPGPAGLIVLLFHC